MTSLQQLQSFSNLVREIQIRSDERAVAQHLNFNVFTTLLQANDEVRLHNRFIHNLLNPEGNHDCGDLFLELFFEVLGNKSQFTNCEFTVRKEASTKHGQIDILLDSTRCGIAIENKIHAAEQYRQLDRYAQHLQESYGENHLLLYLTLNGKESQSIKRVNYTAISYQEHILAWIEKCLQATYQIIPINQALLQYRQVVQNLTGPNLESQTMEKISQHLLDNPELIRMRQAYLEGVEEVKAVGLDRLADDILTKLRVHHPAELRADMTDYRFGKDLHGSIRITPNTGPFSTTKYQIVIEHVSRCSALIIGLESKFNTPTLSETENTLLTKLNELLLFESENNGVHKAEPKATWNGEYWPVGWHDLLHPWVLDEDEIIKLLNPSLREKLAEQIVEKALNYIQLLEKLHLQAESLLSAEAPLQKEG